MALDLGRCMPVPAPVALMENSGGGISNPRATMAVDFELAD
jgi:hypothetical protein